jgi:pilus assembly protein Flp/PilA
MKTLIAHLVWDDQGQDLIEYVLIGSFVSIAVLVAATALGTNLNTWYSRVASWVSSAAAAVPTTAS